MGSGCAGLLLNLPANLGCRRLQQARNIGQPILQENAVLPRHRSGWRKPANKAPPMRDIYARFDPRELRGELFQPTDWDRFVLGHALSIVSIGPENHHDHPATYKVGRQSFSELPSDRHGVSANASKTKPAKLLAVFVVDTNEMELTIPFGTGY
jgi:hypothetical protein